MCFAKCTKYRQDLSPMHNKDGTVNDDKTTELIIPEEIPEHNDNPNLNRDLESGILAFIYESRDEVMIVWTSDEAYDYIKQL